MIVDFGCEETKRIFDGFTSHRLPPDIQSVARRKLRMLHAAVTLADLRQPPGNRLEKLSGGLWGKHSIRVNDQWRIVFTWADNAYQVMIMDYH
jgi:toxin HigB-1